MTIKVPIKSTFKEKFTKKRITENLFLKIVALVVAVMLWYIVVNITDPIITQTYRNVHVKILNENVIAEQGNTLQIEEGSAIIPTVTVKAPRTIIRELGSSVENIVATADMNKLLSDGSTVPIECTVTKFSDKLESIRPSTDYIHVKIEKRKTIQLPISVSTSGEVESGYIVGNKTPNQNQVRVSGPQSIVERVKRAYAEVPVSGFTGLISTQSDIVLLDENEEVVPLDALELNVTNIRVDVEILATKKVPVYYSIIGIPAEGYGITGQVDCTPEVITIAGDKSTIDVVSEIKVPGDELNVTGQTDHLVTIVDIQKYLPQGVRIADTSTFSGKVTLKAYIEPYASETVTINASDIVIEGVPFGFEAEVVDEHGKAEIKLVGLKQNLEKLDMNHIVGTVDFDDYALVNNITEFTEGVYNCVISPKLPEGVRADASATVQIRLKKNEE